MALLPGLDLTRAVYGTVPSATRIDLAARRSAKGYTLEAAIPWRLLGIDPARTTVFGVALNISDNDVPEPAQLTMISSTPNRSWADPRSFGTALLEPIPTAPARP